MISFACPHCSRNIKVKKELAGKKGKCQKCGQPIEVPVPSQATTANSGQMPAGLAEAYTLPPKGDTPAPPSAEQPTVDAPEPASPMAAASSPRDQDSGQTELIGYLLPPQAADEIGRLGPYRVLQQLGSGGMGAVFLAEDTQLKRRVALKAMLPALAASEVARKRFFREAQAAASIEHDHIVPIYQVGEDRSVPFIAMQFLKGQALDERLKKGPPLGVADILKIGREIAKGLAAAHAQGLVHRDIKPANIWLEELPGEKGFRVKILDFGLARPAAEEGHLTQAGTIIGTPHYMAPEQVDGRTVDSRCDLFSLGGVLYRLCTGRLAFQGPDTVSILIAVGTAQPPAPIELNPQLPQGLSELVMQLLAKKPEDRPASATAVVKAIENIEKELRRQMVTAARQQAAENQPPPDQADRKRWWILGGAASVGVCLGIFWLMFHGSVEDLTRNQDDNSNQLVRDVEPKKPAEPEWITLFNAKDKTGWIARRTPKATDLWEVGQAVLAPGNPNRIDAQPGFGYDLVMPERGGCDLYTQKKFGNCKVELEFMLPQQANSGVYLMGAYKVQLTDSYQKTIALTSGDLGGLTGLAPPLVNAAMAPGEWQKLSIDFQAPRFQDGKKTAHAKFRKIMINDRLVQQEIFASPSTGALPGEYPRGPLMLQGSLSAVAFRHIRLLALDQDQEPHDKWFPLFAGANSSLWKGSPKAWQMDEDSHTLTGKLAAKGNLFNAHPTRFMDFELKLQTKCTGAGKAGIVLRGESGEVKKAGMRGVLVVVDGKNLGEVRWLDLMKDDLLKKPAPAALETIRPNDFNDLHIVCTGKHCSIQVNRVTAISEELPLLPPDGVLAFHLGKSQDDFQVQFRNLMIREK